MLDHTLIDIKAVKALEFKRNYLDQLLGYYTLYRLGGTRNGSKELEIYEKRNRVPFQGSDSIVGAPKDHKITHLGIYFARHSYLFTFPVDVFINEKVYSDFLSWFRDRAKLSCMM